MKKGLSMMVPVFLLMSVFAGSSVSAGSTDGHRIVLDAGSAALAGLTVRHELLNNQVSADVTDAQLTALKTLGVAFEYVPSVTLGPKNGAQDQSLALSTSTRLVKPSTQVPYGIKMTYGNPTLTPAGISGGAGVTVAVLDTGVSSHPDLTRKDGSSVITDCVDFAGVVDQLQGSCNDGHGHGTHVTGTIAAAGGADSQGIYGVAPEANIFSYKVLTDSGLGFFDDVARAIRVAADRGANIVTMSLGGDSGATVLLDAIKYANSKGVLVIAAAGNSGPALNTIGYPGAYKEVVAVAAVDATEKVTDFSSRGIDDGNDSTIVDREVEVSGAGASVISTYLAGEYWSMSGTSMATPHVAGLAAKMWQGTGAKTRTWLVNSAKAHDITKGTYAEPGYDAASGYGLPQVNSHSANPWVN